MDAVWQASRHPLQRAAFDRCKNAILLALRVLKPELAHGTFLSSFQERVVHRLRTNRFKARPLPSSKRFNTRGFASGEILLPRFWRSSTAANCSYLLASPVNRRVRVPLPPLKYL